MTAARPPDPAPDGADPFARFTHDELRFMAARVQQHVREHPCTEPRPQTPPLETCQYGHAAMARRGDGRQFCAECDRERKRLKRREGVSW